MDFDSRNKLVVNDVYNFAKSIASEFEVVAQACGSEVIQPVVLRVIDVLEHLESLVCKLEAVEKDLQEMKLDNALLQSKMHSSVEKLEIDIEEVERSWQKEIEHLRLTITRLHNENRDLQQLLNEYLKSQAKKDTYSEEHLIQQLRKTMESLSSQLEEKNGLMENHISCIIRLKASLEHEKCLNTALKNKVKGCEELICKLWEEKAGLQSELNNQKESIERLQQELREVSEQKAYFEEALCCNKDMKSALNEQTYSLQLNAEDYLKQLLMDKDNFLTEISRLEEQLRNAKSEANEYKTKYLASSSVSSHDSTRKSRKIRQLFRFFLEFVSMDQTAFYF